MHLNSYPCSTYGNTQISNCYIDKCRNDLIVVVLAIYCVYKCKASRLLNSKQLSKFRNIELGNQLSQMEIAVVSLHQVGHL